MFDAVKYIREICQQRKIPISVLEKECGFANGYLNPKKLKKIPYDRAVKIADYLGLSVEYIMTGVESENASAPNGLRQISDEDMIVAFWGEGTDMDQEDLAEVKRYAAFLWEKKHKA